MVANAQSTPDVDVPHPEGAAIIAAIKTAGVREIVATDGVIVDEEALRAYECDGLTAYRQRPLMVVLPETTAEVSEVLKLCTRYQMKVVPRGAGTSLAGGSLPTAEREQILSGNAARIYDW